MKYAFQILVILLFFRPALAIGETSYGWIEKEGIRFEIKDFVATFETPTSIKIQLYPVQLTSKQKVEALKDPFLFTLGINSKVLIPEKWPTWTPTAYLSITIKEDGKIRTYTVGENFISTKSGNSSVSGRQDNHSIDVALIKIDNKSELKLSMVGHDAKYKTNLKWKINMAGVVNEKP
jgi:hypothetical protein